MPERVNSFAPILPCVFLVVVATIAVDFISPVRAEESACIERPGQAAAPGAHWTARYDRAKGRKCWFLLDANGRDITASQTQPSASTSAPAEGFSSQIASFFGSLIPQVSAPPDDAPQTGPVPAPRKPRGGGAIASTADNAERAEQKGAGEGRAAAKRISPSLTGPEREALFQEFLRWQESHHTTGASSYPPSSR
jgi:hypothetical protein